jgi:hypothetical protein
MRFCKLKKEAKKPVETCKPVSTLFPYPYYANYMINETVQYKKSNWGQVMVHAGIIKEITFGRSGKPTYYINDDCLITEDDILARFVEVVK